MKWKKEGSSSWITQTKGLRISVHHYIYAVPELWHVTCHELCIERRPLDAVSDDDAKAEALAVVRAHVARISRELGPDPSEAAKATAVTPESAKPVTKRGPAKPYYTRATSKPPRLGKLASELFELIRRKPKGITAIEVHRWADTEPKRNALDKLTDGLVWRFDAGSTDKLYGADQIYQVAPPCYFEARDAFAEVGDKLLVHFKQSDDLVERKRTTINELLRMVALHSDVVVHLFECAGVEEILQRARRKMDDVEQALAGRKLMTRPPCAEIPLRSKSSR